MAEYEKQKDSELEEMRDVAQAEKEGIKHKFEQTEKSIVTKRKDQPKVRTASTVRTNSHGSFRCPIAYEKHGLAMRAHAAGVTEHVTFDVT